METDWMEILDALELLAALLREPFFGGGLALVNTKNGQFGERFSCSSLDGVSGWAM